MQTSADLRILFIDAYDSFTNNIISLLETELKADVTAIRIDTPVADFPSYLRQFSAVVAGPGPGDPRNVADVGHFQRLWELKEQDLLPVLGICLGFQSLVLAHGGAIHQLPEPRHGLVRTVKSREQSIFRGLAQVETVQYHSLHGTLGSHISNDLTPNYLPTTEAPDLLPLAWSSTANSPSSDQCEGNINPPHILMSVRHRSKPFFGIQFHPESICSSSAARKVVLNWGQDVIAWRSEYRKPSLSNQRSSMTTTFDIPTPSDSESDVSDLEYSSDGSFQPSDASESSISLPSPLPQDPLQHQEEPDTRSLAEVQWTRLATGNLRLPDICHLLDTTEGQSVVLDSEKRRTTEVGQFSIIGVLDPKSIRFEYSVGDADLVCVQNGKDSRINLDQYHGNPFEFFQNFMHGHKAAKGQQDIPFWGGLIGYITYEASLQCLERTNKIAEGLLSASRGDEVDHPSLGFVFVERSIVIDHFQDQIIVQSIKPDDQTWLESTSSLLSSPCPVKPGLHPLPAQLPFFTTKISMPDESRYKSRIRQCKKSICSGDSYELCLTDKAFIQVSDQLPSWSLYLRLRELNPAPFGAYLRIGKLSFLSSSPERFMRWTRPSKSSMPEFDEAGTTGSTESVMQFRPIKGTVSRIDKTTSRKRSLSEATAILSTPKEQAENLMIVDLIRHDLHGVIGSGRVSVPKLMTVEEYETVFQLVSVIEGSMRIEEGKLHRHDSNNDMKPETMCRTETGLTAQAHTSLLNAVHRIIPSRNGNNKISSPEPSARSSPLLALPATLPPGSMTGAPKLRSCQILHGLEDQARGAYSGVVGYMDVGGGGDWSVAIRCAVHWDEHHNNDTSKQRNRPPHSQPRTSPAPEPSSFTCTCSSLSSECCNEHKWAGGTWAIGAGGAVTALSTEEGEWNEMLEKLHATLRLFQ